MRSRRMGAGESSFACDVCAEAPPSVLPDCRDEPRVSSRPSDPATGGEIGWFEGAGFFGRVLPVGFSVRPTVISSRVFLRKREREPSPRGSPFDGSSGGSP